MRRSKTFRLLTQGLGVLALSVCLSTGSVLAADDTSGTGTSSHSGSTKSMQTASAHKGGGTASIIGRTGGTTTSR
jgi:hypothetical protein